MTSLGHNELIFVSPGLVCPGLSTVQQLNHCKLWKSDFNSLWPSDALWQHGSDWHWLFLNTLSAGQNGCHFADNIFKWIFFKDDICICIKVPLRFISEDSIEYKSALVQEMAWHQTGDDQWWANYTIPFGITRSQWVTASGAETESKITKLIPWLHMPWLFTLTEHQQSQYWL